MTRPPTSNNSEDLPDQVPLKRGQSAQMQRDMRSKAALKANMARRKAQMRAKNTEAAPEGSPEQE